jgi:hypothetical protein
VKDLSPWSELQDGRSARSLQIPDEIVSYQRTTSVVPRTARLFASQSASADVISRSRRLKPVLNNENAYLARLKLVP